MHFEYNVVLMYNAVVAGNLHVMSLQGTTGEEDMNATYKLFSLKELHCCTSDTNNSCIPFNCACPPLLESALLVQYTETMLNQLFT